MATKYAFHQGRIRGGKRGNKGNKGNKGEQAQAPSDDKSFLFGLSKSHFTLKTASNLTFFAASGPHGPCLAFPVHLTN